MDHSSQTDGLGIEGIRGQSLRGDLARIFFQEETGKKGRWLFIFFFFLLPALMLCFEKRMT